MIGHKASLRKVTKTKLIPTIFSDHSGITRINNKRKAENFTRMWKLNDRLLNNLVGQGRDKKGNKKISKQIKMKTKYTKTQEMLQKQF